MEVYVEYIPFRTTKDGLRQAMLKFGHITNVNLKEARHGYSNKFGFVSFSSIDEAERAIAASGQLIIDGQKVNIKPTFKNQRRYVSPPGQLAPQLSMGDNVKYKPCIQAKLYVTHVQSPVGFYAQIGGEQNAELLVNLHQELNQCCPKAEVVSGSPDTSLVYGAKYSVDDHWYRCKIVSATSDSESMIFFIDYGNCETVENRFIVKLSKSLSESPALARAYSLYGVEAKDDTLAEKFHEGAARLLSLINPTGIDANIYDDDKVEIKLSDGCTIAEKMVAEGYCVSVDVGLRFPVDGDDRISNRRSGQSSPISQSQSHSPVTLSSSSVRERQPIPSLMAENVDVQHGSMVRPFRSPEKFTKVPGVKDTSSLSNVLLASPTNGDVSGRLPQISANLAKELEEYRVRCAKLSEDCQDLKNQLEIVKSKPTAGQQLANVLAKAAEVKKLRQLFPIDKDPIANCIIELSNTEHRLKAIATDLCVDVDDALLSYNEAQNSIRLTFQSMEKERAIEIFKLRDEARFKVCDAINHFEKCFQGLNLPDQKACIKAMGQKLTTACEELLHNAETISVVASQSDEQHLEHLLKWQTERVAQLAITRARSDAEAQKFFDLLGNLQQSLDVSGNGCDNAWASTNDDSSFDSCISSCCAAFIAEVQLSRMVPSSADVDIISRGIQVFASKASAICEIIKSLEERYARLKDVRNSLVPWVSKTPDMSTALTHWKNLKLLKSRLRHRLADRQDIIENIDESDKAKDDLARVNAELADLRPEIQQCCIILEDAVAAVARDVSENFPELGLQHTDLRLIDIANYHGLFSPFRDLEHFSDVQHHEASCTWTGVFNGQKVEVRSYQSGEANFSTKTSIINYFLKVKKLWDSDLQAVFYSKNPLEVLVQVKCHSEALASLKRPFSSQDVAKFSHYILQQLLKVHGQDLIYGHLSPRAVYLTNDGCVLDPPGLPTQRHRKPVEVDGLTFHQEEPSKLSDLKDFGKLLIWMCSPETERPAHSHVSHDRDLYDLVSSLLSGQPQTAEMVSEMRYFTVTRDSVLLSPDYLPENAQVEKQLSVHAEHHTDLPSGVGLSDTVEGDSN